MEKLSFVPKVIRQGQRSEMGEHQGHLFPDWR